MKIRCKGPTYRHDDLLHRRRSNGSTNGPIAEERHQLPPKRLPTLPTVVIIETKQSIRK